MNEILKAIKPEYPGVVAYSKPGENYLIGPDSQHQNNTAFDDAPTRPLDIQQNADWAKAISAN